jgi:FAD synthase
MRALEQKVLDVSELAQVREKLGRSGKTVAQCHGCFDVVHPGHIRYLKFAKELADADIDNTPLFFAASRTEARFQPKTVKNFVKNFRKILTTLPRRRTRNARRRKDAGLKVTTAPLPGSGRRKVRSRRFARRTCL